MNSSDCPQVTKNENMNTSIIILKVRRSVHLYMCSGAAVCLDCVEARGQP